MIGCDRTQLCESRASLFESTFFGQQWSDREQRRYESLVHGQRRFERSDCLVRLALVGLALPLQPEERR